MFITEKNLNNNDFYRVIDSLKTSALRSLGRVVLRERSLMVSNLRSENKGSRLEIGRAIYVQS